MFRLCAVREVVVDAQRSSVVNFKEEKGNGDLRLQLSLSFLFEA